MAEIEAGQVGNEGQRDSLINRVIGDSSSGRDAARVPGWRAHRAEKHKRPAAPRDAYASGAPDLTILIYRHPIRDFTTHH